MLTDIFVGLSFAGTIVENGLNCFALSVGGSQAIEVKLTDRIQLSHILLWAVVVKDLNARNLTRGKN